MRRIAEQQASAFDLPGKAADGTQRGGGVGEKLLAEVRDELEEIRVMCMEKLPHTCRIGQAVEAIGPFERVEHGDGKAFVEIGQRNDHKTAPGPYMQGIAVDAVSACGIGIDGQFFVPVLQELL